MKDEVNNFTKKHGSKSPFLKKEKVDVFDLTSYFFLFLMIFQFLIHFSATATLKINLALNIRRHIHFLY